MAQMFKTKKALSEEEAAQKWRDTKIPGQATIAFPKPTVASVVDDSDKVMKAAYEGLDEEE